MTNNPVSPQKLSKAIPGLRPDKQLAFLYVEAKGTENALTHLRWVSKTYRAAIKVGTFCPPKSGLLRTTSWHLKTPSGQRFYGLQVGGDKEGWFAALKQCAHDNGRVTGEIIGYVRIPARFVLCDGHTFHFDECVCAKE